MKTIKLQVFETECGACGEGFESLHLSPNDYGPILYATKEGTVAFLFPDEDPVWDEIAAIVERETEGARLSQVEKTRVFHAALAQSIDRSPSGQVYFPWGNIPCPRCGSTERSYFGPVDPPRFVEVAMTRVTHNNWENFTTEARKQKINETIKLRERGS